MLTFKNKTKKYIYILYYICDTMFIVSLNSKFGFFRTSIS